MEGSLGKDVPGSRAAGEADGGSESAGDVLDGIVVVVNARGRIVSCTPALGSVLGCAATELVGRPLMELARDDGRSLLGPPGRAGPGFAEGPAWFLRRDGRTVQMFCRRSPYISGSGETYAFIDCRLDAAAGAPRGTPPFSRSESLP